MEKLVTSHGVHNTCIIKTNMKFYENLKLCCVKMRCAIFGCNNTNQGINATAGVKYHMFPKNQTSLKKWVHLCGRSDKFNVATARVCSIHFVEEDYQVDSLLARYGIHKQFEKLKGDAVPTKYLPRQKLVQESSMRHDRLQKRNESKTSNEIERLTDNVDDYNSTDNNQVDNETDSFNEAKTDSLNKIDRFTDNIVENYADNNQGNNDVHSSNEIESFSSTNYNDSKLLLENAVLNKRIAELEAKIKLLEGKVNQSKSILKALGKIFTPGQMKRLEQPGKNLHWSHDDIANGIAIHSAGARAYRLLLKKNYPLPAVSTLRKWCSKIKICPGILKPVLEIMKKSEFKELNRVCVLSFDEMKIRKQYLYDKVQDETLQPANYVQVAMIRGLFGNWKQPVFYDYDCKMTKEKLEDIIACIELVGFKVVAMVCDLGGANQGVLKKLDVGSEKSWFANPEDSNRKIYVFADVPHLLKLIRNNFLDHGFYLDKDVVGDKKLLDKSIIEKLLLLTNEKSDLSITYKISSKNLTVKNAGRQKVKLAAKLFSHTVAEAIKRAAIIGDLQAPNALTCSEFFKLVNDWFDCLNVRLPRKDSRDRTSAFGMAISEQMNIINKMSDTMSKMIFQITNELQDE